jgi:hypothetical protein
MKKYITSLFVLLFVLTRATGQINTQYFDENWKPATKENMVYFRPEPISVNGKYLFKDYYKSGKLQFEGYSLSKTEEKFDGLVKYYSEQGKITGTSVFKNGVLDGPVKTYYENGKLNQDAVYKNGEEENVSVYSYKGTVINGETIPYDLITVYEKSDRVKQIVYDGNLKGIRQEMRFNEYKALYYGADGKLLGEMVFDLYGNPNNGTMIDFEFNPMRVSGTRIFVDGEEQVPSKI